MDLSTATTTFETLERERETEHEGDPPTFSVRLDATVDRATDQRMFRIRVDLTVYADPNDALLYILELAREADLEVSIENSALELR